MAGGMDLGGGGKGGKKPLDTAINLVPFIDLMAVTISFLIMTAVWNQIGRLQVSSSGPSEPTEEKPEPPVVVMISDHDLKVTVGGVDYGTFPMVREGPQQRLNLTTFAAKLKEIRDANEKQATVTINPDLTVKYEDLVRVIDEAKGSGFQNVAVEAVQG